MASISTRLSFGSPLTAKQALAGYLLFSKYSEYTVFTLAKLAISVKRMVVLATSLKVHPAPYKAALRFFMTWWAWPSISWASIIPFSGLRGICPDT